MADYFAVLSRTLAGFGEPKPELREKLYERARMTIRKQLDSHVPALDEPALAAEMNKLEQAIHKVESGFGPPNVKLEPVEPEPALAPEAKEKPQLDAKPDKKPEAAEKPKAEQKAKEPKKASEPKKSEPISEEPKPAPTKEKKGFLKRKAKKKEAAPQKASQDKPAPKSKSDPGKGDVVVKNARTDKPTVARKENATSAGAGGTVAPAAPNTQKTAAPESAATDAKQPSQAEAVDPMDEWAREFLNAQEASKPEVAEALAEIQADRVKSVDEGKAKPEDRAASIAAAATAATSAPAKAKAPAPDLPVFDKKPDETLVIPPAPRTGAVVESGGLWKWSLIALLTLLCAVGVYLALNWENRAEIAARFGMDGLFGSDVTPTPVKTIKIAPPPEPESAPEPTPTTEAPTATEPDAPKSEDRLTGDGVVEQPATPAPDAPAPPAPETPAATPEAQPESSETTQTGSETQQATEQLPAADAGTIPAVAQSAILYEEGGSAAENSFDTGRVVWSTVEEQGGEGEGKVPAIRARVEVPSRKLVLIMTIKRNSDRALPASHLIELVFAVPDDFSGGSIQEINRFVLKESEQDRGQALIGVPARISDGIFLIALNNLESAQKTNEQLLRGRSWVDIPMQYRTGRRALITLEKGLPGDAVFKDVFEAWDKLKNQP
ncbi:MAG: hypothetical protein ACR2PF_18120 [Rhizobiaceae bacterium]